MTDWYQQSLTPPQVIEVRIRIGVIAERDHVQAMVDMYDPQSGVLIATWSAPHGALDGWHTMLNEARDKAAVYLADQIEPF